jgi:D-glycero-D-manno-heptose 1,7-bisphosphate phosphatase
VRAAAFLDRDGVVNVDRDYVFRQQDFEFVPGTLDAARELRGFGLALVVVTNQSGIARGFYGVDEFEALTGWMREQFASHGAALDGVYYCPHHPSEGSPPYRQVCRCRKPQPGLLLDAARDLGLDLAHSVLFGDKVSDLQSALAAGIPHRILLGKDGRELPADVFPGGLATARYRSLADAVQSPSMRTLLTQLASTQVPS